MKAKAYLDSSLMAISTVRHTQSTVVVLGNCQGSRKDMRDGIGAECLELQMDAIRLVK